MQMKPEKIDITKDDEPEHALAFKIKEGAPGLQVVYSRDWTLWNEAVATAAWALYEQGHVELVQRRVSIGSRAKFEYIAIKRRESRKLSVLKPSAS